MLKKFITKKFIVAILIISLLLLIAFSKILRVNKENLPNTSLVHEYKSLKWSESHMQHDGIHSDTYLGGGMLYYGIIQTTCSKVAVVIGSGAGFVPRIVAQAQRDSGLKNAVTYYVDADTNAMNPKTKQEYGQISLDTVKLDSNLFLLKMRSSYAANLFKKEDIKIDYLHIDGDHSIKGILEDWTYYRDLLSENAIITFHDYSSVPDVLLALQEIQKREPSMQFITFPNAGAGITMAQLGGLNIKKTKNDSARESKLSYFKKNNSHIANMEDVFFVPESGSASKTSSHWSYLLDKNFQRRYEIASEFLSDSSEIVELGGFPNSMVYFVPNTVKKISVIEPFGTNDFIKNIYYEGLNRNIDLSIYPSSSDFKKTSAYDLVWLGMNISHYNEDDIRSILRIFANSKKIVIERSNYEYSIKQQELIFDLIRPHIVKTEVLNINCDTQTFCKRTMFFIDNVDPVDNFDTLENIVKFKNLTPGYKNN